MDNFNFHLSQEEKDYLKKIARLSMIEELSGKKINYPPPVSKKLTSSLGAFVTLKKNGDLRGCIGQVIAQDPLWKTIIAMAKEAAFKDPRFSPVQLEELEELEIEISILSPLEKVTNLEQVEPGKHGLLIRKGFYSGLLLPQVATEWGWDRKTFLEQTCFKAGLDKDCYLDKDVEIYFFQAEVF
ncbi:MAG: AmmeMemoRadiSam system protein A [Desulfonauticus sp.]|nr:AmmeMemoRadiSam system protein A [Desulfonauticus sp.]